MYMVYVIERCVITVSARQLPWNQTSSDSTALVEAVPNGYYVHVCALVNEPFGLFMICICTSVVF